MQSKWTELPDCSKFGDKDGVPTLTPNLIIPLNDDLSNAIIATCKGSMPVAWPEPPLPWNYWNDTDGPKPESPVYDAVMHPNATISDNEHQVSQDAEGVVEASKNPVGPLGDFYNTWNYPYQSKDKQWDFEGATNPWRPVPLPVNPVAWIGTYPLVPPPAALLQL
jgi:hypothetical protein